MNTYHQTRADLNYAIGTHIREQRQHKRWTQEMLGERTGLQTAHIGRLERGETTPRADTLYCLAWALDTEVGVLFGEPLPSVAHVLANVMSEIKREKDGEHEY